MNILFKEVLESKIIKNFILFAFKIIRLSSTFNDYLQFKYRISQFIDKNPADNNNKFLESLQLTTNVSITCHPTNIKTYGKKTKKI